MNIDALKTFVSLADCGSFTKAARELLVAQSTVSSRIRELEKELGQSLLSRGKYRVVPTPAGRVLLIYAEKILKMHEAAINKVTMVSKYSGVITVGVAHGLFDCYISDYTIHFMKKYPDIAVKIDIAHSEEIVLTLGANKLDVAFTYCPFRHLNYICVPFVRDRIVLVTASGNAQHKDGITYQAMLNLPLLHSDLFILDDVEWLLPRHHIYPLDINIMSKMIPFLKEGNWFCVLPKHIVRSELEDGSLIEIPLLDMDPPEKQSYIIYKSDYKENETIKKWLDGIGEFSAE